MATTEPLTLSVSDLHAGYGDRTVLNGVDLDLRPGTITTVIGANGAGKSTLLKALFGLTTITAGSVVTRGGLDVARLPPARHLREGICLVAQGRVNFPALTVRENLRMAGYLRTPEQVRHGMRTVLELFPALAALTSSLAGNLSGGEQQLLETGMALMSEPDVLLIDEPSLGLSPKMRDFVFDMMVRLRDTGTTVLMVEQNAVQALRIADVGVVLELGRVGAVGSGLAMLDDPDVQRAYLGF